MQGCGCITLKRTQSQTYSSCYDAYERIQYQRSCAASRARETLQKTDIYGYVLQIAEASAANATTDYLKSIANKPAIEQVDSIDEATKFREAKAEMQRLGFSDYNEYLDYLEFKRLQEERKKASK